MSCEDLLLLVQICLMHHKQHPSDVVFCADLQPLQLLQLLLLQSKSHCVKPQVPMVIDH